MAVNKVELLTTPPNTQWLVKNCIPLGHTSNLFAPGGGNKTRLVSNLAVQVTRPQNVGTFLGYQVRQGKVLILDADDPTTHGYQLWLNRFLTAYPDADRSNIDLRSINGGLTPDDVKGLIEELKGQGYVLIVVDTFVSAFLGMDTLKAHHVQAALVGLAELAKALTCAVLVLDHVGKLQPGQTVASKGPYGAAKTFSPRAIFALSRVPPKEVEGRDVFRLDCTKMSYAAEPSPIGFEVELSADEKQARVKVVDLPNQHSHKDKAKTVILEELRAAKGEPVTRQVLLNAIVQKVNVSERYAVEALKELLEQRQDIETYELGGKGKPKAYSIPSDDPLREVAGSSLNDENADRARDLFDEHPSSSLVNELRQHKQEMMLLLKGQLDNETVPIAPLSHDDLMLLEALVWSGRYEGETVGELKAHLWRYFERGDETVLETLFAYLKKPEVQALLRIEVNQT
jgi:RecA-family ATPase